MRKHYGKRPSKAREEIQSEALSNAVNGQALTNYPAIFEGFMSRGIPESEIRPRENVFTYNAWKALGRQVRKGEHGIKVLTYIACEPSEETKAKDPEAHTYRRPWSTTVFHVSQTDPAGELVHGAKQFAAGSPAIAQPTDKQFALAETLAAAELGEISTELELENSAGEEIL